MPDGRPQLRLDANIVTVVVFGIVTIADWRNL